MAPSYVQTHVPFGLHDPAKRTITNPIFKDRVTFTKYGCETNGEYFQTEVLVNPSGGVQLHRHYGYGETMTCTRGVLGLLYGEERREILLKPGQSHTVEHGALHKFFNPSSEETMEFSAQIRPGHAGFEKLLHLIYGMANDGLTNDKGLPHSWVHMSLFATMGEASFPDWGFFLMRPVFGLLSWWCKWTGEEKRLLDRYYGTPVDKKTR